MVQVTTSSPHSGQNLGTFDASLSCPVIFLTPTSLNTASAPPLAVTHLGANWSQGARDSTRLAGARDSLGLAPGQAKEGQGGLPALLAQRRWPDSNVAPQSPLLLLLLTSFWALVEIHSHQLALANPCVKICIRRRHRYCALGNQLGRTSLIEKEILYYSSSSGLLFSPDSETQSYTRQLQ